MWPKQSYLDFRGVNLPEEWIKFLFVSIVSVGQDDDDGEDDGDAAHHAHGDLPRSVRL